jgi:uncharacterized protein YndB with AHSA1/START domain
MTHTLELATPTDLTIVLTRDFDAPRELLFAVHTEARHFQQWMLGPEGWTMAVCEMDVRAGGAFRCVWRGLDGTEMAITGVYLEVDPPARVVHTETWGGDWPETTNTLEFVEADGRTTLISTMLFPTREARDAALGTGMCDGVDAGYACLDEYLAGQPS